MTTATITVNRPGLAQLTIVVTAESTIGRGFRLIGSYQFEGVTVDGTFFPLVRTAHFMANHTMLKAEIEGVMRDLVDTIRRLNPDWPQLESKQIGETCGSDGSACVDCNPDADTLLSGDAALAAFRAAQPTPAPILDPWDDGPELYGDTPMSPERAPQLLPWAVELNCLGEPMPLSGDEALARQLVAEINEAHHWPAEEWARRPEIGQRYDAKSARVRAMGFEIGADETGQLVLLPGDAVMIIALRPDADNAALLVLASTPPDDLPPMGIALPVPVHPDSSMDLATYAAMWDARSDSLSAVALALDPVGYTPSRVSAYPAGSRVCVTFGPDAGHVGTVVAGPDMGGYYSVKLDGRALDAWGSFWYYLPDEIALTTTPPAEERPWANDAAYAAEGRRLE